MIQEQYKVAFVTGTPSWHKPEFYHKMSSHARLELMVYFCSHTACDGTLLRGAFGVKDRSWGLDLLQGYRYKFLRNYSPLSPAFGKTKLFSNLNFGIWNEIKNGQYHAVVLTMWNDISYWIAALACNFYDKPFFFAGDSTVLTERGKPKWLRKVKQHLLGRMLFPKASGFLHTGELNRRFYLDYGVPEDRLFFYPQSVDCKKYLDMYPALRSQRQLLRHENGVPQDAFVILFVGRLSSEKRPIDLVKAFVEVKAEKKALLIVGDGKLKPTIEEYIQRELIRDIYFLGFKPRTEIVKFYALADLLVLPSDTEPHSDVVKEAMCFGLPIIVSDRVGAGLELIKHNENGFIYPCGDTKKLANYINQLSDEAKREHFGQKSFQLVKDWDHDNAIDGLLSALDHIYRE